MRDVSVCPPSQQLICLMTGNLVRSRRWQLVDLVSEKSVRTIDVAQSLCQLMIDVVFNSMLQSSAS